jgi:hypothetical protein
MNETVHEVSNWLFAIGVALGVGFFAGFVVNSVAEGAFWKFLQERRRLQHVERMRIIEQRDRFMGIAERAP